MNTVWKLITAILVVAATIPSAARANQGVFDFLDPCIAARDQFRDYRESVLRDLDRDRATVDKATATDEFRKAWLETKKKQLRPVFDSDVKPLLLKLGVNEKDLDASYTKW